MASPDNRLIASAEGWSIREYVCRAGPHDRPFEERHEHFTIAAVLQGSFVYKTGRDRTLMQPGSLLLGNHGNCFECGHDHGIGDRCVAFHLDTDLFAEVSATAAGGSRYRFSSARLPMTRQLTPMIAGIERLAHGPLPLALDEAVCRLAETVIAGLSGHRPSPPSVGGRDERRIADVLRYIENRSADPIDLDALASIAGMSKFHFLRIFRKVVEMTPYQYVLAIRMRRAAILLTTSSETVASIGFDAGFGDLSTFTTRFRVLFGISPTTYRRRGVSL